MNIFQTMVNRISTKTIAANRLPALNDFVDIVTSGKTDTLSFEGISKSGFETHGPSSAAVGVTALFHYENLYGRFRFRAACLKVDGRHATFALPDEITVVEEFSHKRQSFRLKKLISVQWRYAPEGAGYGPFARGKLLDLSMLGTRLNVGRELRKGTLLEFMFEQIVVDGKPLVTIGELVRPAHKDAQGVFTAGVRFSRLKAAEQNAIGHFIQSELKVDRTRHIAR